MKRDPDSRRARIRARMEQLIAEGGVELSVEERGRLFSQTDCDPDLIRKIGKSLDDRVAGGSFGEKVSNLTHLLFDEEFEREAHRWESPECHEDVVSIIISKLTRRLSPINQVVIYNQIVSSLVEEGVDAAGRLVGEISEVIREWEGS